MAKQCIGRQVMYDSGSLEHGVQGHEHMLGFILVHGQTLPAPVVLLGYSSVLLLCHRCLRGLGCGPGRSGQPHPWQYTPCGWQYRRSQHPWWSAIRRGEIHLYLLGLQPLFLQQTTSLVFCERYSYNPRHIYCLPCTHMCQTPTWQCVSHATQHALLC
jgi:hypothetical protein